MLVWSFIPTITLVFSTLIASSSASHSNFTLRTAEKRTSSWVNAKCATVAGNYLGQNYNFGCLCDDDVDEFCANNNLNGYLKLLLNYYIQSAGRSFSYPPNAQPTCDGAGGYSCGSLAKTSSGCGASTCDPTKCSTNGGCCPRGQSYNAKSGQCCGNVGCNRGQTCTPALGCAGYVSNNVCCLQSDKSWVGQTTICCPSGQSELNGKCVCPSGTKVSSSDSTKCVSSCSTGTSWCTTKCCPTGATEVNGVCSCPAGQKLNGDGSACVSKCSTGTSWCSTVCCPTGTTEVNGVCKCPTGQELNSNNVCVSSCSTGMSWCTSKCCPTGATEVGGVCTCPAGQKLNNAGTACVTACAPGYTWSTSACCPNGSSQVNGGSCSCPSGQTWNAGKTACITACSTGTNWCTSKCCPTGSTEVNGVCTCPTNQKWNAQKTACVCSTGQSWCTTQCCPTGASEVHGTCVCPTGQSLNSDGTACESKCAPGLTWGGNVCCPSGSKEINKACVCTDTSKQLSSDGKSCTSKCSTGTSWCTSKCCPTGATEKNGVCVCPTGTSLSSDGSTCNSVCETGTSWCKTQCCKSYLVEDGGACVCSQSGFYDDGTKCSQPNCNTGYQYDVSSKQCKPVCDVSSGYQYKTGWKGNGMCCLSSSTACNTVCCPAGQSEVDNTGKCCPIGSTYTNGQCVSPTGKAIGSRSRMTGRDSQLQSQFDFGLPANKDSKLCPVGLAACPIPGTTLGEYECLDTANDLQSCGGCASLKTGVDCTAIPGAKWMGCNTGKCEVYSCRSGFKLVNGSSCVRL